MSYTIRETQHTTTRYWNCKCEKDYIQPAYRQHCPKCDAKQSEQPKSRICDVKAYIIKNLYESIRRQNDDTNRFKSNG